MGYNTFAELARQTYVDIARTHFTLPGKKQTTSRIATITGLSRKEVARLEQASDENKLLETTNINRAARVISGWVNDPEFKNEQGNIKDLPFEGADSSFSTLVKKYSGDITPRTIADELARTNAIETTDKGFLRLKQRAYIPENTDTEILNLLGEDVADLIKTISHNLSSDREKRFYQRKVIYNNIPKEYVDTLRNDISIKAQHSLEELNSILSKYDRDVNPDISGSSKNKLGVGIYYFEEELVENDEN